MAEVILDEPVKTKVLKAIQACIEDVTGVQQVIRNPSKPIDRDTARFPLVFVFDEPTSAVNRNRIEVVTMPIQIEVWLKTHEGTIGDEADILEAAIYQALWEDADVKYYAMSCMPDENNTSGKFYQDEFLGGITMRYEIKYGYKWMRPYILPKEAR